MTDAAEAGTDAPADPIADAEGVILFEDGVPGFPDSRHFMLIEEVEDAAFQLLQSMEEPDVAFIVAIPWLFFPDYAPVIDDLEAASLGIESEEDVVLFCPVTLDEANNSLTMNLLGPFVVHTGSRRGRQLVLTDQPFSVQAEIDLTLVDDDQL